MWARANGKSPVDFAYDILSSKEVGNSTIGHFEIGLYLYLSLLHPLDIRKQGLSFWSNVRRLDDVFVATERTRSSIQAPTVSNS